MHRNANFQWYEISIRTTAKLYGNISHDCGNWRYLMYGKFEVDVGLHLPLNNNEVFWEVPDKGLLC